MIDISELDLIGTAEAIRDGEITAEAACEATLAALRTEGRALNAVVRLYEAEAMQNARAVDRARSAGMPLGPLAGATLAHKDLFYRRGRISACGSVILKEFEPDTTADVLQHLDRAGAIDAGSLHMAEFALSPTGYNWHYGPCRNPWNPAHVTGGSSSGSGAAVAARLVPAALGTDTGGSVRLPAAMCGLVGLKPTAGLLNLHGVLPLAPSLDTVGVLTRTGRDAARLLSVLAGPVPDRGHKDYERDLTGDIRRLRISVPQIPAADPIDPEIRSALEDVAAVLRGCGAETVTTRLGDMPSILGLHSTVLGFEAAQWHRPWLEQRPGDYSDQVRNRIGAGLTCSPERYKEAMAQRAQVRQDWLADVLDGAEIALLPVLGIKVPTIEAAARSDDTALIAACNRFTRGINYLGLPAVSVPCGLDSRGLPIGFQLVGPPFSEGVLLKVADAYQSSTECHRLKPPSH